MPTFTKIQPPGSIEKPYGVTDSFNGAKSGAHYDEKLARSNSQREGVMNAKRCIANVLGVVAFSLVSLTFPCSGHADAGEYTADFIVCKKKVEGVYFY